MKHAKIIFTRCDGVCVKINTFADPYENLWYSIFISKYLTSKSYNGKSTVDEHVWFDIFKKFVLLCYNNLINLTLIRVVIVKISDYDVV